MPQFISPVANEAIIKLQYLLQNTLYTYTDIITSLVPSATGDESQTPVDKKSEDDVNKLLSDKLERLETLNSQIQLNVDLLPDSSLKGDKLESMIEILNKECESAATELKELYNDFNKAFELINNSLEYEMKN